MNLIALINNYNNRWGEQGKIEKNPEETTE